MRVRRACVWVSFMILFARNLVIVEVFCVGVNWWFEDSRAKAMKEWIKLIDLVLVDNQNRVYRGCEVVCLSTRLILFGFLGFLTKRIKIFPSYLSIWPLMSVLAFSTNDLFVNPWLRKYSSYYSFGKWFRLYSSLAWPGSCIIMLLLIPLLMTFHLTEDEFY